MTVGVEKDDSLVVFLEIGLMPDSVTLWLRKSMDEQKSLDLFGLNTSSAALNRVSTCWTASLCSLVDLENINISFI